MTLHYYSTCILTKWHNIDVEIKYEYTPSSPGYFDPYWGGEGPSSAEIDVKELYVIQVSYTQKSYPNVISRAWLESQGWLEIVTDLVWDEILSDSWEDLYNDLVNNAEADE